MQIYLPIAEMAIPAEMILMASAFVGFLSGALGVGGGFLLTPILIFFGIPPTIAVGSQAPQLVASSFAGVMGHWRKANVDIRIGVVMLCGGFFGTIVGIFIFKFLKTAGQIDFAISALYILLLGMIGLFMCFEILRSLFFRKNAMRKEFNAMKINKYLAKLPYKVRFPRSKLYISVFVPAGIGFFGGILASVLGIGGGFLLVPAMIYILGMPAALVAGTSLFQMIFTTSFATIMHATASNTVDIVLSAALIVGGVFGAQFGVVFAGVVKDLAARIILATIIVLVCTKLICDLFLEPGELYSTLWGLS